jgi:sugar-specific transcriptional regulator TrmB
MSKDSNLTSTKTRATDNLYDTINQSITRVVDEVAKTQPQYSQCISNLQLDYIQAVKNTVQNTLAAQKIIADAKGFSLNVPFAGQYVEQLSNQTNEITNNIVKTVQVNNQVAINSLDAARDNIRIYSRTTDSILEFNSNLARAWTSFFSVPQQQQFFRP